MLNTSRQARSVNEILRYGECRVEGARRTANPSNSTINCIYVLQHSLRVQRRALATPYLQAPARAGPGAADAAGGHTLEGNHENTKSPAFAATRLLRGQASETKINGGLRYRHPGLSVICRDWAATVSPTSDYHEDRRNHRELRPARRLGRPLSLCDRIGAHASTAA